MVSIGRAQFECAKRFDSLLSPVLVLAFSINSLTNPTLSKITPWHARVRCGNSRCSIGLYFEQYGGECATRISTRSRSTSPCKSSLNRYWLAPLLPPPSHSSRIELARG